MDVKALKSFQAVYQENSMSKAAKKLFITPQGLSKNIRLLEQELGTSLFLRTRQGVCPTESAHLLMKKSGRLIREFEELKNELYQLENGTVLLRIGCACGVFNLLPFPLIRSFMEGHPEIRAEWCEYSNEEVKEKLLASEIEYGLVVGSWAHTDVAASKLAEKEIVLLVYEGHAFDSLSSVTLDMLKGEKLILMNEYFHLYHDVLEACQVRGFQPQVIAKTADASFQYKLCSQKAGLAVVPGFILDIYRMEGVRAIPFEEHLKWEIFGAYKKSNEGYEAIRQFAGFLQENRSGER